MSRSEGRGVASDVSGCSVLDRAPESALDRVRDGLLDGPPFGPPELPPDDLPGCLPDDLSAMPDLPPADLPVVLWPTAMLRTALAGRPGVGLARVVSEAIDLDGDLGNRPDRDGNGGELGGAHGGDDLRGDHGGDVLSELSGEVLGDLAIACGRLQAWAAGVQARVVAERAARDSHPLAHSSVVAQVSGELVVTGSEASEVVVRAESGADHPSVIAALIAGRIDVRKAHTLLRTAAQLTVEERAEAIALYLPAAPSRTWRWLQRKMLAFAKARHGADQAAEAAARRRCVQIDRAENDMAWLSAYLPAVDAAAVWGVVDDMARQLRRTSGEERDLGQLRADCLTGIVTGRLVPADRFTEGGTREGAHDAGRQDVGRQDAGAGGGDDGTANRVCTCGGRAPVHRTVVRVTPTRPVVRVTVPAGVLLGLDDAPGDLAGFGPVPAATARLIATDATWQRLVTDPVTGVLVDYSTTTYQPGSVLRRAVQARDETCTFPHCEHPASWADLDHVVPFDHDLDHGTGTGTGTGAITGTGAVRPGTRGQTRADNLQALCRRHHLLKTHGGWGVVRDPVTGVTTWTAPSGRRHTRPPTVLDTRIGIDQVDPGTSYDLSLRVLTGPRRTGTEMSAAGARTRPREVGCHGDPPRVVPGERGDADSPPF